ncbi:MAG: EAL domain-containing protein [Pseudomonadales bacterium]|nr:EAL domain-containing protein [Pseudomonadales bacterium]
MTAKMMVRKPPWPKMRSTLAQKLGLFVFAIVSMFFMAIFLGWQGLHAMGDDLFWANTTYQQRVASLADISRHFELAHRQVIDSYQGALEHQGVPPASAQLALQRHTALMKHIESEWDHFQTLPQESAGQRWVQQAQLLHKQCVAGLALVVAHLSSGQVNMNEAMRLHGPLEATCAQAQAALDNLRDYEVNQVGNFYRQAARRSVTHQSSLLILAGLAVLLGVFFSLTLIQRMRYGLRRIQETSRALANGDTSPLSPELVYDELGVVMDNMVQMQRKYLQLIRALRIKEAHSQKLARMYALQSGINHSVLRMKKDPQLVLENACSLAVERGRFRMAWIGQVDEKAKRIIPVASAGVTGDYLNKLEIVLDASAQGQGPSARAVIGQRTEVCNDLQREPSMSPWRVRAEHMGFRASISLPILVGGDSWGVLALYSEELGAFDAENIALCEEVAGDIAFALSFHLQNARRLQAEEGQRQSEAILRQAQSVARLGSWYQDTVSNMFILSDEAKRLFGLPKELCIFSWGALISQVHPADRGVLDNARRYGGRAVAFRVHSTDAELWLEMQQHLIEAEHPMVVGTVQDVTERRLHENKLQRLSQAIDQSVNTVVITDLDSHILYVNEAFERISGYSREEALGKNPRILQSGKTPAEVYKDLHAHLSRGESWRGEFINRRKDGSEYLEVAQISPVRQPDGEITHFMAVKEDVTEQRQAQNKIKWLADYDPLTNLPNRRWFIGQLEHKLDVVKAASSQLALLFIDLNRFKEINDTQGHVVGDSVLKIVAKQLAAVLEPGQLLARLGGDEFVIMVEAFACPGVDSLARKLLASFKKRIEISEIMSFHLDASIGISMYPDDADDAHELLRHADIAMYRAKGGGEGYRFYQPEMGASIARRTEIAERLSRALEYEILEIYFQPQVCLQTRNLIGMEVLLRWKDVEWGWVSPAEFIPIAEERGMIVDIGAWVFKKACLQLHDWQEAGYAFSGRVAINVSAQEMSHEDFPKQVQAILAETGVSAQFFELEITESGVMMYPERSADIASKLVEVGFALAIDDFGTGYSSLAYLKRFSVSTLKVDQSFIRNLLSDHIDHSIVATTIAMAKSMGMVPLAEGVENEAQANMLRELGCDRAQGFLYDRALPAAEFAHRWLTPSQEKSPITMQEAISRVG